MFNCNRNTGVGVYLSHRGQRERELCSIFHVLLMSMLVSMLMLSSMLLMLSSMLLMLLLSCLVCTDSALEKLTWRTLGSFLFYHLSLPRLLDRPIMSSLFFIVFVIVKYHLHCVVHKHGDSHGPHPTRHRGQVASYFHHLEVGINVDENMRVYLYLANFNTIKNPFLVVKIWVSPPCSLHLPQVFDRTFLSGQEKHWYLW